MIDGNSLSKWYAEQALKGFWLTCSAILAAVILCLALWIVPSYFEAQAYERVTGQKVSTWDAMWIELRVQAGPKAQ